MSLALIRRFALLLIFAVLGAAISEAQAAQDNASSTTIVGVTGTPGLTINTARIAGGRLLINGTATVVDRLIKVKFTNFQTRSDAQKKFSFVLDYRTPDCRITLTTVTGEIGIWISDCGPRGVEPRGVWSGSEWYEKDEIALYGGSNWRALRTNRNKRPGLNPADWQLFAAKGDTGAQGQRGLQGEQGEAGPAGVTPAGEWQGEGSYETNDLVNFGGSTWRKLPGDTNNRPDTEDSGWELFAAGGQQGDPGPTGPEGPAGPAGAAGAFAGARIVRQTCNDGGGWIPSGGSVYCIAACAEGEIPYSEGAGFLVDSSGVGSSMGAVAVQSSPAGSDPLPANKWFTYYYAANEAVSEQSVTMQLVCGNAGPPYYRFETGPDGGTATSIFDSADGNRRGVISSGGPAYSADVPFASVPQTGAPDNFSMAFTASDSVGFDYAFPLNTSGDATLEFWVNPGAPTYGEWSIFGTSDANQYVVRWLADGQICIDYRSPTAALHQVGCTQTASVPQGVWSFVAVVKTANVYSLYVNNAGTSGATVLTVEITDLTPDLPTSTEWAINASPDYPGAGLLDEVRFTDQALAPSQFLVAGSEP